MTKTYHIMVRWYADEQGFGQWFVEMDSAQLAKMRALLARGVEGRAFAGYTIKPHKPGTYTKTLRDIGEVVSNRSYWSVNDS
jgi:hypothetical protein